MSKMREKRVSRMCENAFLSIKNPKASRALKRALDPGCRLLASLHRQLLALHAGPPPLTKSWIRTCFQPDYIIFKGQVIDFLYIKIYPCVKLNCSKSNCAQTSSKAIFLGPLLVNFKGKTCGCSHALQTA